MEYKGHHITDKKKRMVFLLKVDEPFKYYMHEGVGSGFLNECEVVRLAGELKKVKKTYANSGDIDADTYFKIKQEYNRIAGCYELTFIPCYSRLETDEEQAERIANDKKYWDKYEEDRAKAIELEKLMIAEEENKKVEEAKELLKSKGYTILGN